MCSFTYDVMVSDLTGPENEKKFTMSGLDGGQSCKILAPYRKRIRSFARKPSGDDRPRPARVNILVSINTMGMVMIRVKRRLDERAI